MKITYRLYGLGAGQVRPAAITAGLDFLLLATLVTLGVASAGDVLVSAWLQTLWAGVAAAAVMMWAGKAAPAAGDVDRGDAVRVDGSGGDRWLRGRRAAKEVGPSLLRSHLIFTGVLGFFVVALAMGTGFEWEGMSLGLVIVVARSAGAIAPTTLADIQFTRRDDFAYLAAKVQALTARATIRLLALHVGLFVAVLLAAGARTLALAVVAVVVAMSFVGALWDYPGNERLAEERPEPGTLSTTEAAELWRSWQSSQAKDLPSALALPPPPPAPPGESRHPHDHACGQSVTRAWADPSPRQRPGR